MKTLITLLIAWLSFTMHAQKTYLKIEKDSTLESVIMYPPGTEFELKNKHGYTVLKDNKTPRIFEIDGNYQLTVFPSYKKGKDVYYLEKGAKVILETVRLQKDQKSNSYSYSNASNVKFDADITDSKTKEGMKNLLLTLSNGIQFEYKDGQSKATLNGKPLTFEGKYVVKTQLGTLKVSFNPKTGEAWWVFEDKDQ
jgi:hypothetical protein